VADPEAVSIVFHSGVPITMVGCNVTTPTLLKKEHIERIRDHGSPSTDLLYRMTERWLGVLGQDKTSMHDPLAVTAVFNMEFLETMMLNVNIETRGELTSGLTVVNRYCSEEMNRVRTATDVRSEEFIEFMMRRILA
jgi:inosine-uridine nucleoside N-ribohydrolase